jgi:hypothetical protein
MDSFVMPASENLHNAQQRTTDDPRLIQADHEVR